MKKILMSIMAVSAIMFCSCNKNDAEQFAGEYNIEAIGNYDVTGGSKAAFSDQTKETGKLIITLSGKEGDVVVSGDVYNTTGHAEDGVLYLDAETHVGAGVGAGITFLGYTLVGIDFTTNLQHGNATIADNTLTWSSSGVGTASVTVLGVGINLDANVSYSNTATRI